MQVLASILRVNTRLGIVRLHWYFVSKNLSASNHLTSGWIAFAWNVNFLLHRLRSDLIRGISVQPVDLFNIFWIYIVLKSVLPFVSFSFSQEVQLLPLYLLLVSFHLSQWLPSLPHLAQIVISLLSLSPAFGNQGLKTRPRDRWISWKYNIIWFANDLIHQLIRRQNAVNPPLMCHLSQIWVVGRDLYWLVHY